MVMVFMRYGRLQGRLIILPSFHFQPSVDSPFKRLNAHNFYHSNDNHYHLKGCVFKQEKIIQICIKFFFSFITNEKEENVVKRYIESISTG